MRHQRTITIEIITGEMKNTAYGSNTRETNLPTQSTLGVLVI
jgi:hypothetical protein